MPKRYSTKYAVRRQSSGTRKQKTLQQYLYERANGEFVDPL